jgi:WD40 repeat protein
VPQLDDDSSFPVALDPSSSKLAAPAVMIGAKVPGTIRLWNLDTGKREASIDAHAGWIQALAYSPDGELLASGGDDGLAKLWDAGGVLIRTLGGHTAEVWSIAFSSDGKRVLTGSADGTAILWDVSTGEQLAVIAAPPDGWLVITPSGVAGADGAESALFWQVGSIRLPGYVGWQRESARGSIGRIFGS